MPSKPNRVCKTCGEKYYFCQHCAYISAADKYKIMFCSKNCRDIFHTLSRYNSGAINKLEAKELLFSLDMSKQNQFFNGIQNDINEIMKADKKNKKKEKNYIMSNEVVVVDNIEEQHVLGNIVDEISLDNVEVQHIVDTQNEVLVDVETAIQVVI